MEYRKEQMIIVACDENGKLRGKWNILTNEFVGVKGNPVKTIPNAFKSMETPDMPEYIANALGIVNRFGKRYTSYSGLNRLEQLISLELSVSVDFSTWEFLRQDDTKLSKALVQFLKDNYNGIYNATSLESYKFYKEHEAFFNRCGSKLDWAIPAYREICNSNPVIPVNFVEGMIVHGVHEKVFAKYTWFGYASLIRSWYDMIKALGDTLEVKHNIISNYIILQYLYEQYRDANYNKMLNENNNLSWLYYENDVLFARPLISREEFHIEAEVQQNCVERMYMERVAKGQTHVVAIRKKSNPSKPYITCEVTNEGQIRQYLLRYNYIADKPIDTKFYTLYKDHLQNREKE